MSDDAFNLSEVLTDYQNNPADVLDNFCSISDRDADIGDILNDLTDRLAVSPEAIADDSCFGSTLYIIYSYNDFNPKSRERIIDLILSATTHQINRGIDALREEDEMTPDHHPSSQKQKHEQINTQDSDVSFSVRSDNEDEGPIVTNNSGSLINDVRERIERYCFLVFVLAIQIEKNLQQEVKNSGGSSGFANNRKKSPGLTSILSMIGILLESLHQVLKTLSEPLAPQQQILMNRLFVSSTQRDVFVGMILKPCYLLMENEVVLKDVRGERQQQIFIVISMAVVHFNQVSSVQTSLDQLFLYFEHLAEPLADLLNHLFRTYGNTTLCEEMIKEISTRDINSNDNKGPKAIAALLVKLSQIAPKLALRQFTYIVRLLDSEVFTIRSAVVESAGIILLDICKSLSSTADGSSQATNDDMERHASAIGSLFDLLEERVLDINPYTRVRAIQALTNLTELNAKFSKRRPRMTNLAVQALQDKSSLVRRNSIRLLSRLISTHPFHFFNESGRLNLSEWEAKCKEVETQLNAILPTDPIEGRATQESFSVTDANGVDENMIDVSSTPEGTSDKETEIDLKSLEAFSEQQQKSNNDGETSILIHDGETISKLQLTYTYHKEAVAFILKVHEGLRQAQVLLHSKNKTEVIESMDIFVLADAYNIETARAGVRSMIHLVWAKGGGNNDEALAIQKHLLSCYQSLFFDPPSDATRSESNNLIARSLVSLTYGTTVSEITSLERLLGFAMSPSALSGITNNLTQRQKDNDADTALLSDRVLPTTKMISDGVVKVLWKIYGHNQRLAKSQRRGAVIILGMLAKADPEVVDIEGLELLLKVGLGQHGREDFKLARYTCIVLQRMIPEENSKKSLGTMTSASDDRELPPTQRKLAESHEVIKRLAAFIILPSSSMEWFSVCEEAVNAIYSICEAPDAVISHLLRLKTKQVFAPHSSSLINECQNIGVEHPACLEGVDNNSLLSQLLFFAGHAAVKTLVYLEKMEARFKRRKMELDRERVEANERERETNDRDGAKDGREKGRRGRKHRKDKDEDEEMTQDQELNLIGGGTTEDDFSEELTYIREDELMYGQQSLLSRFGPLARELCLEIIKDLQRYQRKEEKRLQLLEKFRNREQRKRRNSRSRRSAIGLKDPLLSKYTEEQLREPVPRKNHSKMLVVASTLSLAKMMCVSSRFCEENLTVLLTLLEVTSKTERPVKPVEPKFDDDDENNGVDGEDASIVSSKRSRSLAVDEEKRQEKIASKRAKEELQYQKAKQHYESEIEQYENSSIVRSNIVLGLGDLAVQFNHVMEDNTEYVYRRLRDNSRMVQRTTLLTLTFLILAGQVKAKDQQLLGQMARCLEDSDERIANLARIFFLELATKDNAIYNNFIDMFNSLISYTRAGSLSSASDKNADLDSDIEMEEAVLEVGVKPSASSSSLSLGSKATKKNSSNPSKARRNSFETDPSYNERNKHNQPPPEESEDEGIILSKEAVHRILKFLVGLVDKERYIKQLSDKLATRLAKCETLEMWDYTAYVLGLLPHKNEDITKKVQNGFQNRNVEE